MNCLGVVDVANRCRFGQLEDQTGGVDARVRERAIDDRDELRIADGLSGNIHIERQRAASLGLPGDQRNRLPHHPGVDRENGAEPFGDVQKGAWREQTAVVGAQPEEQLVLTDLVGREVEDGLAVQLELIVRERTLNALGLHQPRRCSWLCVGPRSIDREPVPARFLRLVHGEIGRRQDLDVRETVEQRDADTGRDRNLVFGQHRRLAAQRLHDAVRDHLRLLGVDLGQDDSELVTAQPRQDVRLADPASKRRGDRLEQIVARFVAELVVDGFEMIQIEQQHGPAAAIAGRGLGLLGQRLLEAPAVEQRRQKIVIDEVLQTPFELLTLGDVLHLRDEVQRSALVVANERDAQQYPDQMAPGVTVSLLDLILLDVPVEQLHDLTARRHRHRADPTGRGTSARRSRRPCTP